MRSTKATRWLSGTLAALMLAQGMCLPAGAAGWWNNWRSSSSQTSQAVTLSETKAAVQLQNGTAIIPSNANNEQVKEILFNTLVKEANGNTAQDLEWEYKCEGKRWDGKTTEGWGSIFGGSFDGDWFGDYSYNALKDDEDGSYQVRIKDTTTAVTLTKAAKLSSTITLNEGVSLPMPYNEDGTVDYDTLEQKLFTALVFSSTPELTVNDVTIEYYAENVVLGRPGGTYAWMPLEGGKSDIREFPAISTGEQKIRISYAGNDTYYGDSEEVTVTITERTAVSINLKSGCTVSTAGKTWQQIHQAILDNVVDSSTCDLTVQNTTIEYKSGYTDWSWKTLTLDEIEDNQNLTIRVKYNGSSQYQEATSDEVEVRFAKKSDSIVTLNPTGEDGVYTVGMAYSADGQSYDYTATAKAIYTAVVASTVPGLTAENVKVQYDASLTGYFDNYRDLNNSDWSNFKKFETGQWKIKITWAGDETYYGFEKVVTVNVTERPEANIQVNSDPTVQLTVDKDLNLNVDKLYQDMFDAIVASSTPELTVDDVTITYYAEAETGSLGQLGHAWVPLEGGKSGTLTYPAISAGTQQVHIYWAGNQTYAPTTIEATVQVNDREQVQFNLNDGPYEVGMKFTADQGYDYAATAAAIYNAVVASTSPVSLSADDVTVEYNTDKTGLTHISYKPLNEADATGLVKFGTGTWEIRISWAGNQQYRGNSVTVNVTTTDNRLASSVALKSGVSFTYNMDVNVMKQAIFDNVIDWENSTLPDKETLTVDDFDIEYKAKLTDIESGVDVDLDDIPGLGDLISSDKLTQWVPLEGKVYIIPGIPGISEDVELGKFPQIGAGENQQIRISYKGNADYRPSGDAEGTVTVNKAKVSVKVNSTNIYADETLPENFITTDPVDEFDIYTIYAGITSNVTTGIYLDLPDRYTNNTFLKILDPIVEKLYGKSFTQMLNDGVTVGELRQLFSTQELLDLLDKLNIDTGTFGQILTVVNNLPGILDSVRISFGTPNRAGLYTVAAVTDSKNYETGVGIGFLLTKMRFSGPKLTWNQEISGKLTAEQAKNFDFGATLWYNGELVKDQSSVHYLYSGFTSKWRIYSSTTTPPTEPGSYVVTVCILGGNYMAAPITRSFQITK